MITSQNREFTILAHISTKLLMDKKLCGWGATINVSPNKRKLLYGSATPTDSSAFAVYAELTAIESVVDYLNNEGIHGTRRIKCTRQAALDTLNGAGNDLVCRRLAERIKNKAVDCEFSIEKPHEDSLSMTMANRAIGSYNYKCGFNWRSECETVIPEQLRFSIQEFYSRKDHENYEYLSLAYLSYQYTGIRKNLTLPLSARSIIDARFTTPESRDMAAVIYKCGMTPEDACKCVGYALSCKDRNGLKETLDKKIRALVNERDHENRNGYLSREELDAVVRNLCANYYENAWPLRTLKEAVLDAYLERLAEKENRTADKTEDLTSPRIVKAIKSPKACPICGSELNSCYTTENKDVASILRLNNIRNQFCSEGCFCKALGLKKFS